MVVSARKPRTDFVVESWNHECFKDKHYVMLWGPYPLEKWHSIEKELIANFAPGVKHVKYRIDAD